MKKRIFDPSKFEPEVTQEEVLEDEINGTSLILEDDRIEDDEIEKDEFLIDLSENVGELSYTLEINGIPTFPQGDIQGIKAKAKQGKTHTILCLMIALFKKEFMSIKSKLKDPKICYFATEEHPRSLYKLIKKVHRLCNWNIDENHENFKVYTLRRQNPKERSEYIENKIRECKPDVVFIDGIRDLLYDFNNIEQSNAIVTSLLRISEECNCAIVNVLHTNKGYSDSNMRGHLGTELLNKCSDVLEVEKRDRVFCVKETDSRNIETGEWAFALNAEGLPEKAIIQSKKELKKNSRDEKIETAFSEILAEGKTLTFSELRKAYMDATNFKIDAANKHITEMTEKGLLVKKDNGKYKLN